MAQRNLEKATEALRTLRGILKPKPGTKSFAERWAAHKREEMELEEAKFRRLPGYGNKGLAQ